MPAPLTADAAAERAAVRTWVPLAALLLVVAVAAFFRFWHIAGLPPGLFGDEATDGLDALDVLAGRGAVFFPANFGREGLHMWIVAGAFRLLGVSAVALRLPSVLAGLLTALATLWLGLELGRARAGDRSALGPTAGLAFALIAALYLSTSYFHLHFSRFGIRGVFTPLCGALAFAAFWRGVNSKAGNGEWADDAAVKDAASGDGARRGHGWFALSGLFLGLGMHFYTAGRFLPVFLGGFLVLQTAVAYLSGQRAQALLIRHWRGVALLFLVTVLVFAPLGVYFWQHPGSFSQRAGEVSAFREGNPWLRIGQAALANVLQFFMPGRGDQAQFYNLPGRPVFDPLTAGLALLGLAALFYRWRQPAALFLLAWWPALLLPSFLATDRFPTLPRVLGTIPGIYFFPAAGLLLLFDAAQRWQGRRSGRAARWLPVLLACVALLVHAGLTYRDYFQVWGRAPATYDAFEEDMAQAADWLAGNAPEGHVYLSSDIYRHPTFMLLHEHATVSQYFAVSDPDLSWFDARGVLPLPPRSEPATYLLAASAAPAGPAAAFLNNYGRGRDERQIPGGGQALAVVRLPATAPELQADRPPDAFSDRLALIGATWAGSAGPQPTLYLYWQTAGPDPAGWPGYRLQVAGEGWQAELPFDDFRPPEWVPEGRFLTWRQLTLPAGSQAAPGQVRLRLLAANSGQPLAAPATPDGWHTVSVNPQ